MKRQLQLYFFLISLLLSYASMLSATSYTYTNSSGDDLWSNPNNWSPVGVPGAGDDATINNAIIDVDININVNTLNVNGNTDLTFTHSDTAFIGTFNFSKGWLISTNKIVITDALNWTGNSEITCTAGVDLTSTAVSTISGTNNRNLYTALLNEGTIYHTGGTIRFQIGGSLVNKGTFTTDGSAMMVNSGGTGFSNQGVYNKTGTSSLALFSSFDLSSGSQLDVEGGTLQLLGGGTFASGTTVNITSGATLNLGSGTFSFDASSTITGGGNLKISGGTTTIESNFNLSGTTEMTSGTLNLAGSTPFEFQTLTLSGGKIQGAAPININTQLNWSGTSTINSNDTLTIESAATGLIFTSGSKHLYSTIVNEGLISHTGGNLRYNTGGNIINKATMTVNGPTAVYDDGGIGIINEGTFEHQNNTTLNFYPEFYNSSTGYIKGRGTLAFSQLTNNGTLAADLTFGTLNISGDYGNGSDLDVEFDGSSHGNIVVSGNVTLAGNLNINSTGAIPDGTYTILSTTGGTISGNFDTENVPANLTVSYSSNSVSLAPAPLPVELSYFRLINQTKRILLRWQTSSEANSDRFVIEHSTNGREFIDIGSVTAVGYSDQLEDYAFLHQFPTNGENYYRLRQIDLDGHFEYSDIRVMSFYNFDKDISVFPNPTQGSVVIKNQKDNSYALRVIDINGKVVYRHPNINPGATMLDLSKVAKGVYTLKFFDDTFSYEERLMILE